MSEFSFNQSANLSTKNLFDQSSLSSGNVCNSGSVTPNVPFGKVRARGSNGSSSGGTLTSSDSFNDTRNVMRLAYKQLKGDGPHLFDFSKPFNSSVNLAVAARVTEQARQLPQCQHWDHAMWQSKIAHCAVCRGLANHKGVNEISSMLFQIPYLCFASPFCQYDLNFLIFNDGHRIALF